MHIDSSESVSQFFKQNYWVQIYDLSFLTDFKIWRLSGNALKLDFFPIVLEQS